ncbi:MAG: hypothetical protein ABGZ17_09265 [Planctomycetaceae bacterium]
MNRENYTAANRWRLCLVSAALALSMTGLAGCNYVVFLGYLIGGPPSIEPAFDLETNKSLTDYEVTVAVVCYAPKELKWDFENIDYEVGKYVAYRMGEHKIKFVNPDIVRDWLDKNPDWDHPEEIGEALGTSYVIYIDMHEYGLYEEATAHLFRGHAEVMVSAYEMSDDGSGDKIFSKELTSKYPLHAPRSTSEVTYSTFKRQYLSRLSEEIGRMFYESYNGDDIHDAM